MLTNEVVDFNDGNSAFHLEIAHANGYIAAKRALMIGQAMRQNKLENGKKNGHAQDEAVQFARVALFPDVMSPVVKAEGFSHWPITLEEYFELDEVFINLWLEAVYKANPQWQMHMEEEGDKEKKEMQPSSE